MESQNFTVRVEADVRQAPSRTSTLLHVAQPGRRVKQMGPAITVDGVSRVPLLPRGWIDAVVLEPEDGAAALGDPAASPQATCSGGGDKDAAGGAAPAAGSAPSSLLEQLRDDRQLDRGCSSAGQGAISSISSSDMNTHSQSQSQQKGRAPRDWWEADDAWNEAADSGWHRAASAWAGNCAVAWKAGGDDAVSDEAPWKKQDECRQNDDKQNRAAADKESWTRDDRGMKSHAEQDDAANKAVGDKLQTKGRQAQLEQEQQPQFEHSQQKQHEQQEDQRTVMAQLAACQSVARQVAAPAPLVAQHAAWEQQRAVEQQEAWAWQRQAAWDALVAEKEMAERHAEQQRQRADMLETRLQRVEAELQALRLQQQMGAGIGKGAAPDECTPTSNASGYSPVEPQSHGKKADFTGKGTSSGLGATGVVAAAVPVQDDSFFSGSVKALEPSATIECPEAAVMYGCGDITVPAELIPMDAGLGVTLCFHVRQSDGQLEAGDVRIPSAAEVGENMRYVGVLKAMSTRTSGDRVGWVSCSATRQLFNSDVYVHGTMLEGLRYGDVVSFLIHVNAKGQPQASIGTMVKHASLPEGHTGLRGGKPARGASVNAVAAQIGRVVPLAVEAAEPPIDSVLFPVGAMLPEGHAEGPTGHQDGGDESSVGGDSAGGSLPTKGVKSGNSGVGGDSAEQGGNTKDGNWGGSWGGSRGGSLGNDSAAASSRPHGFWASSKGECHIFDDPITNQLSYEESVGDGSERLHGKLELVESGTDGATGPCWQASLMILEEGQSPWYGPSFGEKPEVVGDIRLRLLDAMAEGTPQIETRIKGKDDKEWEAPVLFTASADGELAPAAAQDAAIGCVSQIYQ